MVHAVKDVQTGHRIVRLIAKQQHKARGCLMSGLLPEAVLGR